MNKKITIHEYSFLNKLKNTDIVPEIHTLLKSLVVMERYPFTLGNYIEKNKFTELSELENLQQYIIKLIDNLHEKNILHGDLHSHNIVLNPDNMDVRIIDFGESRLIDELDDDDIEYFNKFLDPTLPFTTTKQIINYERTNWILDYFNI